MSGARSVLLDVRGGDFGGQGKLAVWAPRRRVVGSSSAALARLELDLFGRDKTLRNDRFATLLAIRVKAAVHSTPDHRVLERLPAVFTGTRIGSHVTANDSLNGAPSEREARDLAIATVRIRC